MIKLRPSTEKEQITLDILRGLFGIMLMLVWGVNDINNGRVAFESNTMFNFIGEVILK